MDKNELMRVISLLESTAPTSWLELKILFQYQSNMSRFITFYKEDLKSDWIRGDFGGFDLLDFYDSIKTGIDLNKWPQLEICFDRDKKLTYKLIEDNPHIFDKY